MTRTDLKNIISGLIVFTIHITGYCNKPTIEFSKERGYYYSGFELTIYTNNPNGVIKYTLDGSDPRYSANSQSVQNPAKISVSPYVNSGRAISPAMVVRACAINNTDTSEVKTNTYIFPSEIKFQSDVSPALAPFWPDQIYVPHVDPPNLINWMLSSYQIIDLGVDNKVVQMNEYLSDFENAILDIPTLSLVTDPSNLFDESTGNYVHATWSGMEWEKPGSIELINSANDGFQSNTGIRIRGGVSCRGDFPKHGFRLFFRNEYGNGKLNYPLFEDQGVAQFDKIDLRSDVNNGWPTPGGNANADYVHEPFARDIHGEMNQPFTRTRFYHLFLNGMYWGLYETEERPEASFAASYMGGVREDYDVVKSSGPSYDYPSYTLEATDGNLNSSYSLWQIAKQGFSSENYNKVLGLNPDGSTNPAYIKLLDPDNLIDYMMVIYFSANSDGPADIHGGTGINNFFAIFNRQNPDGFKYILHDVETSFSNYNDNITNLPTIAGEEFSGFNPAWLHQKLMLNQEYRQKFADRAYKYLYNDGVLTTDKNLARFKARANTIDLAIIGESARWGDVGSSSPMTKINNWDPVIKSFIDTYFPHRTDIVINQFKNMGWLNNVEAPEFDQNDFTINETGYQINKGETFKLVNPNQNGDIYYTLDNIDPRESGGAISNQAIQYTSEIKANKTIFIKARIKDGNFWSALHEKIISIKTPIDLKITEINYNPPQKILGTDTLKSKNLEFIEIKNCFSDSADVSGFEITRGIQYKFPIGSIIPADSLLVIASDSVSFKKLYGFSPFGQFKGNLNNDGDEIQLTMNSGLSLLKFIYNNGQVWYDATNGCGFTLVFKDKSKNQFNGIKEDWRVSTNYLGTPGKDDLVGITDSVLITEIFANSNKPLTDAIELYNASGSPISIGKWYLSDDRYNPAKWQIPENTILGPHQYKTFYEGHYIVDTMHYDANEFGSAFSISSAGESVYLFSSTIDNKINNFLCEYKFGPTDMNTSIGIYKNSIGKLNDVQLDSLYLGKENMKFKESPVIFKTIMYHPAGNNFEYIVLKNRSDSVVNLFSESDSTVSWKIDGIKFDFPANVSLNPDDSIYLVEKRIPADNFKNIMNLASNVRVFNYSGQMKNSSEILSILKPFKIVTDSADFYAYINLEKVEYSDQSPWPINADGKGFALQRKNENGFANDVTNWTSVHHVIPDANAGNDKRIGKNIKTHLDGSGSSDPDGKPITYQWSIISKPENSFCQLTNNNAVNPQVLTDVVGNYVFALQVNNGESLSLPSYTTVYTFVNKAPIAWCTSYNMTANLGKVATLNGSRSYDPDFEPLTYFWEMISRPDGSNAEISSPTAKIASIIPDVAGQYAIDLTVSDGNLFSNPFHLKVITKPSTDMPDISLTDDMKVYPNPVNSVLNIDYNLNAGNELSLSLTDPNGREVYRMNYTNLVSGIQRFSIVLKDIKIKKGIYILHLQSDEIMITKKIIYI